MAAFDPVGINISISGIKGLDVMRQILEPKAFNNALRSGVQYAAKATPAAVAKQIAQRYTISSSRVKQDVRGPYIQGIGTSNVQASLYFSRKPPTAAQFKPRTTRTGLTYSLSKGQRTIVPHGFIGTARGRQLPLIPVYGKPYRPDFGTGRTKPRNTLSVIHAPSVGSLYLGQSRFGTEIRTEVGLRINEMFAKGVERAFAAKQRGFG